jgi:hypothetical protein
MNYPKRVFLIADSEDDRKFFDFCIGDLDYKIDLECSKSCESALQNLTDESEHYLM